MATDGLWERLSSEEAVALVGAWLDGANDQKSLRSLAGDKKYAFVDRENASTHVIRNALGGADELMISRLLSIPSPVARRYRDDISCTILFFDGDGRSGGRDTLRTAAKAKL